MQGDMNLPGEQSVNEQGAAEGAAPGGEGAPDAGVSAGGAELPSTDAAQSSETAVDGAGYERQLAEQQDRYLRLAAEYENFRKRAARERAEAGTRAQADFLRYFIDALDDLARFAHLDPTAVDSATVVQGVEMVEKKFLKALAAAGLEVVNPLDQPFDPSRHEAVMTEPALSREDDHMVARVFQPGYVFNGQLLRPARVVVKQWNG
jgi:molecular chaperone GrpE